MRLAIVRPKVDSQSLESYNSQELGLARGLAKQGVDTDIFVLGTESAPVVSSLDAEGPGKIRQIRVPYFRLPEFGFAIFRGISKLLRDGGYSVVHINESHEVATCMVASACAKSGIPVVLYQGMYEPIPGRSYAVYAWFHDRLCIPSLRRNISASFAKTSAAKQFLSNKGFGDIRVLPVGLDIRPFEDAAHASAVQETAQPKDAPPKSIANFIPQILYVGQLEPRRNPHFILDLAERLGPETANFVIAGDGPLLGEIEDRVAQTPLENVRLLGKVPQRDLPAIYRESSLFLLPSNYEIYGMVVLESMYFGVPVISTATAGPTDLISSGYDGLIIEDMSVDRWSEAIMELLADRPRLSEFAANAMTKVTTSLTWDSIAARYLHELDGIARTK